MVKADDYIKIIFKLLDLLETREPVDEGDVADAIGFIVDEPDFDEILDDDKEEC